jgi:alpha-glucosidase (family GH31 glycosyl hydrolase)
MARSCLWSRIDCVCRYNIKIFWLDGSEPEISTAGAYASSKYYNSSLGLGQQVGMMYPYFHTCDPRMYLSIS